MITLTVDPARFENPVHRGLRTLEELRARGVPAIGVLFVEGVESGTLSISAPDLGSGEITYSWTDN